MAQISLSKVHPDKQQIKAQLIQALQLDGSWTDLLPNGAGDFLLEAVSAIGDYDQFSIEQGYIDNYPQTARRKSSVYAAMRMLGVRLARKTPSKISVTLTRKTAATDFVIPAMSTFTVGDVSLFNREPIVFSSSVLSVNVDMFEGKIQTISLTASGKDFQEFVSVESQFFISDLDTSVFVNTVQIPLVTDGLWFYKNKAAVQDSTTKDGQLQLFFGNETYGFKPALNSKIDIRYIVTLGANANDINNLVGKNVSITSFREISGTVITGFSGGSNEPPASLYKKYGAGFFAASKRANSEDEYRDVALQFRGVADALIVGQQKLAPSDNRYMNLVRVSLLGETLLTASDKQRFLEWYQSRITYPTRVYLEDPKPVSLDIVANIYVRSAFDLNSVKDTIVAALNSLFLPRPGFLSSSIYRSDIYDALLRTTSGVDFVELITPTLDVASNLSAPIGPILQEIKNVGTLFAAGTYTYGVSLVNSPNTGQTLVASYSQITIEAGSSIKVVLPSITNISSFQIFGRGPDSPLKLISSVPAGVNEFVDDGSIEPTVSEPTVDTAGVFYLVPGNIVLNMQYSSRS